MAIELQDKLYTSAQVADVLGVSLRTLYRYMEDGRIESMKTASGRHRFTKDQILSFLDGGGLDLDPEIDEPREPKPARGSYEPAPVRSQSANDFSFYSGNAATQRPVRQERDFIEPMEPKTPVKPERSYRDQGDLFERPAARPADLPEIPFEEDDDLDDFNFDMDSDFNKPQAPASRFDSSRSNSFSAPAPRPVREDFSSRSFDRNIDRAPERTAVPSRTPDQSFNRSYKQPAPFASSQQPTHMSDSRGSLGAFSRDARPQAAPVSTPSAEGLNIRYYKSDYNDLIDLAKRIKETSLSKDLEYAFTLNAGLSLHYLIDPFTILHFYVNPEDLQIWKSALGLIPVSSKSEANIGVLVNTDVVFIPTKEIGGFKVVEDKLLLKDLSRASEDALVREFRQRIMAN